MANTNQVTDGTIGIRLADVDSTAKFPVGHAVIINNAHVAIYMKVAAVALNPATTVTVESYSSVTASSGSTWLSLNDTTAAAGYYVWVRKLTSTII